MSDFARVASRQVMEALDMPEELRAVQDFYWQAQREWEELDRAYRIVVSDVLKRIDRKPPDRSKP